MDSEAELVARLKKVEALFAGTTFDGERTAAQSARERILARLRAVEEAEPAIELRFSMPDVWSRSLFLALLRRYEIRPYRYPRQRRTTVMARVTQTFAEEVLVPEFQQLQATLHEHLASVTQRVVAEAMEASTEEADESDDQRTLGPG